MAYCPEIDLKTQHLQNMFTFVNNDWYTPDATTKRQAAEMPVQTSKKPKIISTSNNAMDEDMRNEAEIASLLAAINLQQPEALQSGQVIYCIEIEITIFALRGLPKTDRELYTMLAPASEAVGCFIIVVRLLRANPRGGDWNFYAERARSAMRSHLDSHPSFKPRTIKLIIRRDPMASTDIVRLVVGLIWTSLNDAGK